MRMSDLHQSFLRESPLTVVQVDSPEAEREVRERYPHQNALFLHEYEKQSAFSGLGQFFEPDAALTDRESAIFQILVSIVGSGLGLAFIGRATIKEKSLLWRVIGFAAVSGSVMALVQGISRLIAAVSPDKPVIKA